FGRKSVVFDRSDHMRRHRVPGPKTVHSFGYVFIIEDGN
ncbi:MAG: hypothetical protein QOF16_619, partial [Actinomycetota bacterium]|nr:hypothetical protein [Actinomycetota bacterium]